MCWIHSLGYTSVSKQKLPVVETPIKESLVLPIWIVRLPDEGLLLNRVGVFKV